MSRSAICSGTAMDGVVARLERSPQGLDPSIARVSFIYMRDQFDQAVGCVRPARSMSQGGDGNPYVQLDVGPIECPATLEVESYSGDVGSPSGSNPSASGRQRSTHFIVRGRCSVLPLRPLVQV